MQLLPRFNPIPILKYMLGLNITLATEGTSQTFLRIMHCPWFTMSYKHARWVPDKSFIDIIHRGLDHYGTSSILVALIGSLYCHIIIKEVFKRAHCSWSVTLVTCPCMFCDHRVRVCWCYFHLLNSPTACSSGYAESSLSQSDTIVPGTAHWSNTL